MTQKNPKEYGQTPIAKQVVVVTPPGGAKGQTPIAKVVPKKS